jgi:hypothetical protein
MSLPTLRRKRPATTDAVLPGSPDAVEVGARFARRR